LAGVLFFPDNSSERELTGVFPGNIIHVYIIYFVSYCLQGGTMQRLLIVGFVLVSVLLAGSCELLGPEDGTVDFTATLPTDVNIAASGDYVIVLAGVEGAFDTATNITEILAAGTGGKLLDASSGSTVSGTLVDADSGDVKLFSGGETYQIFAWINTNGSAGNNGLDSGDYVAPGSGGNLQVVTFTVDGDSSFTIDASQWIPVP
jgi:hypothetical protein